MYFGCVFVVGKLPYMDALQQEYNALERQIKELQIKQSEVQQRIWDRYSVRRRADDARQEAAKLDWENNWEPRLKTWVETHLKPGDRLKMKGCKDGEGIREFIRIDTSYGAYRIRCLQILRTKRRMPGDVGWTIVEEEGQNTLHLIDKLTHVEIGGKWVKVKELPEL